MPGKITLRVIKGPIEGQVFTFDEHDTFIFGRSPDCHARLPEQDDTASRHHFILEVNPPDACLRDLGSLNGTYVNKTKHGGRARGETPEQAAQRKFPEVNLRDGDEIRVGETVFSFHVEVGAACCNCGRPIGESERSACQWIAGAYLCAGCRQKAAETREAPKPPEQLRCRQCAKDVSDEVGQGRSGDYVCQSCRAKAEADPAELLRRLFREIAPEPADAGLADVPGYQIGRKLGEGGMGAVYLAKRVEDGAAVALKVMLSRIAVDDHSRNVFLREVETTRALRHPNIVEFIDSGSVGGVFYFALEYCAGGSVADLIKQRGGPLPLAEAGPIMLATLDGLAFAHAKEFVHRDLKPPNILLAGSERRPTAKIADLGLAKNFAKAGYSGMTATGSYGGSYPYMPREQVTNFKFVKPVSDVWSMGATFYNLLTGRFPRDVRRGQDPMDAILKGEIVPIRNRDSGIPKRVAEVIDRSLADKPAERFQDAGEMRKALEKVL
jgi:serine/threonine-protein kinase